MMRLRFAIATPDDVPAVVRLRNQVADHLVEQFGPGHWGHHGSEKMTLFLMKESKTLLVWRCQSIVGTLRLATKKPWAIDVSYFSECNKALYLLDMAVTPKLQNHGIGRSMLDEARKVAIDWPANAIRLDAYDTAAGAGDFYRKCGFTEVGRVVYRQTPLIYYEWLAPASLTTEK